eukprot:3491661-Rhodomonas_salina.1
MHVHAHTSQVPTAKAVQCKCKPGQLPNVSDSADLVSRWSLPSDQPRQCLVKLYVEVQLFRKKPCTILYARPSEAASASHARREFLQPRRVPWYENEGQRIYDEDFSIFVIIQVKLSANSESFQKRRSVGRIRPLLLIPTTRPTAVPRIPKYPAGTPFFSKFRFPWLSVENLPRQ